MMADVVGRVEDLEAQKTRLDDLRRYL